MDKASTPPYPLEDYGVIGNLHTAAIVSRHGSIDFMCYPRFDSPTAFARLLGDDAHGHWTIACVNEGVRSTAVYLPDTAILVTRHHHRGGVVEVTDFMVPSDQLEHCQLVRKVDALSGSSALDVQLLLAWPYGKTEVAPTPAGNSAAALTYGLGETCVRVYASPMPDGQQVPASHNRTLSAGDEPVYYLLQSDACGAPDAGDISGFCESLLRYTNDYWREWTARIVYSGKHRDLVYRSAITLKLCTSAQYGSSVAAVTTSLPESIGGKLNWDYRFSWIRDSAFSMYAMLRLGLTDEADHFITWIEQRCGELADASELGLMYRVDGDTDLAESTLDHLPGYEGSTPVRIGNGAAGQRQLDIYGELIDTVYLYDRYGNEITYAFWQHLTTIIDYVVDTWREPDHGIWEARDEQHQYTASKVLAWVAIDRGIRIAQHRGFPAPHARWLAARDELYRHLYDAHYSAELDAWTQHPDTDKMDGSLLMMPLVRFVMPEEPAWLSTLAQLERTLVHDCLVYRNESDELQTGYDGTEGYFAMCSLWYIEVLAKMGRVKEADRLLTKFASYANPLGLYSEEIAMDGRLIGNFPQAFTHLGFISAALQLEQQIEGKAGERNAQRR